MKRTLIFKTAAVIAFCCGLTVGLRAADGERFDHKVRQDFFAGFSGNQEAMARAMKASEEALAENPKHAEAMVWHGGGLFTQAQGYFQKGDQQKGMELFSKGQAEMDMAVQLAPNHIGVRIPRGAVYLTATRFMGNAPFVKPLLEKGLSDYQASFDLQKDSLDKLGSHPLGELLFGLAEGNSRLGNEAKAKEYFDMVSAKLPTSEYAKRAALWMETKSLPASKTGCVGCHVAGK